jgi:hypothetical protein
LETVHFANALIGRLAQGNFHTSGSLAAYLALPERDRGGDEANIVDSRVTRLLLEALGYEASEINYNAAKDNLRPDFEIKIRDFPGSCFIVEDKTTTETRLEQHKPQLAGYMAAFRCARGLLVNGDRILGYDDTGPISSANLQLSLQIMVRSWRGEDVLAGVKRGWDALAQQDRDGLAVLLRRYGRTAFEGINRLIDDLTLDRNGTPHALDGSTWQQGQTRIPIVNAHDAPDHLVEVVQDLIAELREDVAVQFAVRSSEYDEFKAEIQKAPGSAAPADQIILDHATTIRRSEE